MRIVSLLPSATEIVCALGASEDLVGISHECDYPPSIAHLPKVTRAKLNPQGSSREIHDEVAGRMKKGLSLYDVDVELLKALKPDVILTQDQCEVCAVSLSEVEAAVAELTLTRTKICSLKPNTLKEVSESFLQVGVMIDRFPHSVRLARVFWDGLKEVGKAKPEQKPSILCLEWLDPFMVAGHWTPELIQMAGAEPLLVSEPGPFLTVDFDAVRNAAADFTLAMPCGFNLDRTRSEARSLAEKMGRKIFVTDGNQFFNRSGPRLVDSAEILSCILGTASPDLLEKHHLHWEAIHS